MHRLPPTVARLLACACLAVLAGACGAANRAEHQGNVRSALQRDRTACEGGDRQACTRHVRLVADLHERRDADWLPLREVHWARSQGREVCDATGWASVCASTAYLMMKVEPADEALARQLQLRGCPGATISRCEVLAVMLGSLPPLTAPRFEDEHPGQETGRQAPRPPGRRPAGDDADGDGVVGAADRCPDRPEDVDGHEDGDGCPDPDNDGDGIADTHDGCPDRAENLNGVQDDDGCPDADQRCECLEQLRARGAPAACAGSPNSDSCVTAHMTADVQVLRCVLGSSACGGGATQAGASPQVCGPAQEASTPACASGDPVWTLSFSDGSYRGSLTYRSRAEAERRRDADARLCQLLGTWRGRACERQYAAIACEACGADAISPGVASAVRQLHGRAHGRLEVVTAIIDAVNQFEERPPGTTAVLRTPSFVEYVTALRGARDELRRMLRAAQRVVTAGAGALPDVEQQIARVSTALTRLTRLQGGLHAGIQTRVQEAAQRALAAAVQAAPAASEACQQCAAEAFRRFPVVPACAADRLRAASRDHQEACTLHRAWRESVQTSCQRERSCPLAEAAYQRYVQTWERDAYWGVGGQLHRDGRYEQVRALAERLLREPGHQPPR